MLIVLFKSKMNMIGLSVIDGLMCVVDLVEVGYKGLVVW